MRSVIRRVSRLAHPQQTAHSTCMSTPPSTATVRPQQFTPPSTAYTTATASSSTAAASTPSTSTAASQPVPTYGTRNKQYLPRSPSAGTFPTTRYCPAVPASSSTLAPSSNVFPTPAALQQHQQQRRIRPLAASTSPITSITVANQRADATRFSIAIKPQTRPQSQNINDEQQQPQSNQFEFPLPGVVLHPDDATSKVLSSIGRAFLSVVSPSRFSSSLSFHRILPLSVLAEGRSNASRFSRALPTRLALSIVLPFLSTPRVHSPNLTCFFTNYRITAL